MFNVLGFVDPRPGRREENRMFEAKPSRRSKNFLFITMLLSRYLYPVYIKSYALKSYIYNNYTHNFDKVKKLNLVEKNDCLK